MEDLSNNIETLSLEELLNSPVTGTTTDIAEPNVSALRAELDRIYDVAFATPPKPVQFARLMASAKRLHDQLSPSGDKLSSFTADIAARTGLHIKKVQRLVRRGLDVDPVVLDLVDAHPKLNRGQVLDRIVKADGREEQLRVFEALRDDANKPASQSPEKQAEAYIARLDAMPADVKRAVLTILGVRLQKGEL